MLKKIIYGIVNFISVVIIAAAIVVLIMGRKRTEVNKMKGTENAYEGENRSLHMKERIGYGVGDFANNMMYTPVNSFFTYFLTNVAGLGAGVV